jgi:hypothetical protein
MHDHSETKIRIHLQQTNKNLTGRWRFGYYEDFVVVSLSLPERQQAPPNLQQELCGRNKSPFITQSINQSSINGNNNNNTPQSRINGCRALSRGGG